MGLSYVVGSQLFTPKQLDRQARSGRLVSEETTRSPAGVIPYTPIGIGRPLSIELMTVYIGDAPGRFLGFLTGKPSLLVTTGVKGAVDAAPAPKAINQLIEHVEDFQLHGPKAFEKGSPIVYYTPALTQKTLLTQYHLVVDSFDEKIFKSMQTLFNGAGALPIFAPAATVLLAAGQVSSVFGKLGKSLIESGPFLDGSESIELQTPGLRPDQSRAFLVYNDRDQAEFEATSDGKRKYEVRQQLGGGPSLALVEATTGQPYDGRAPYMILNLDGAERNELAEFAPTLATAEMLEEFYGGTAENAVGAMHDALKLLNDMEFRKKAEEAQTELDGLEPGSEAYAEKLLEFEAYKANIVEPLLQLT